MNFATAPEREAAQPRPLRRVAAFASTFALTLAFQLPFFDRWFSGMDEGHLLAFAQIAARGGVLYRDATFYPLPGAFLLLAALYRIFPPSIWLARLAVSIEFAIFVALLHLLLQRLGSRRFAACGVGLLLAYRIWCFPHWQIYSYSTTALLVLLTSGVLLLRFAQSGRRSSLVSAGLFFGLGTFCKQDYAAAHLLAFALLSVIYTKVTPRSQRPGPLGLALAFLGPAALVGAAAGAWFWSQGILGEVIQFTVLNHLRGIANFDYSKAPALLPLFTQDPVLRRSLGLSIYSPAILYSAHPQFYGTEFFKSTALFDTALKLFYWGPVTLVGLGALRLWRHGKHLEKTQRAQGAGGRRTYLAEAYLWAVATSQLLLFFLNRPQNYTHLVVLYWPFVCLGLLYAHTVVRGRARAARAVLHTLLAIALAVPSVYGLWLVKQLREVYSEPIGLERAGIRVTLNEAEVIREAVDYIRRRTPPRESVAVLPYLPALHFLADRKAPHRTAYILWPVPEFPDRDERVVRAMEKQQTRNVVYVLNQFHEFSRMADYAPAVFDYLVDHFEVERFATASRFGLRLALARRERDTPEGRTLLSAPLDTLQLEIESPDGRRRSVSAVERSAWLARDRWPFRRVIALRPSARGDRTVLGVPVSVARGESLQTAILVNPDAWGAFHPSAITFGVDLVGDDGRKQTLLRRTIDPQRDLSDRRWCEIDVDLTDYANRRVTLEFSTAAQNEAGERLEMAGFELPRLVRHEAPALPGGEPIDCP